MKKNVLLFALIFTAMFFTGCLTTLHPIFTVNDLVTDSRLEGTWTDEKNGTTIIYRKPTPQELGRLSPVLQRQSARILVMEQKNEESSVELLQFAFLVKLGKYYYLDYYPVETDEIKNDFFTAHYFPMHSIYRIDFTGDRTFDLRQLDAGYLESLIQNKKIRLGYEVIDDERYVITAPTKDLQQYILKYCEVDEAYNGSNRSSYTKTK